MRTTRRDAGLDGASGTTLGVTCRRRKRGTRGVQRYEVALLDRLVETTDDLATRRWQPSRSVCFAVSRPKAREIHAAAFADRVVHHLLVPALDGYYEPNFLRDIPGASTDTLKLCFARLGQPQPVL